MARDFDLLHAYWHSLADGDVPDHDLVDPGSVLDLLPYLMIVEFEEAPFRVRYRLSGSKLDYVSNIDLTGRYLDEFAVDLGPDGENDPDGPRNQAVATLIGLYMACRDMRKPVYGVYGWPDKNGYLRPVEVAMFPLLVRGEIRQCLALEYYGFDPARGPSAPALDPRLPVFD
ncbi:PAS domain-containing protein [Dongia soli]|uniref:PAS domain-containing protein n=1 Tax=Dongia soli TaxID=600628 RepID=A0ABU5EGU5_9PROT|nr:PAS domain-containing protein [Dongia soli]MDY0884643.1 PAS domain-containing protein [Dongia soli]